MYWPHPLSRTKRIRTLLVAAIIFSTKWKWCQVQGKVVAQYPSAFLHHFAGHSSHPISRSLSTKESSDELNKAPKSVQLLGSGDSVRHVMWSEIDARTEQNGKLIQERNDARTERLTLTNGGVLRMKRIVAPSIRRRVQADRAMAAASPLVKYVFRKPIEENFLKKISMKRLVPTVAQIWNDVKAPQVLGLKSQPENYRMLEELAVREWEKQQKNTTEREIITPEPVEELFDNNSSEEWIPILIDTPKNFIQLPKNRGHSGKQHLNPEALSDIEIVADASEQHVSSYRNGSQTRIRNQTASENNHSRHQSKTTTPSVWPLVDKRLTTKTSRENKSMLDSSQSLKKFQTIRTEITTTEVSKKQPATTFRGTLKFGDKLY